MRGKSQLEVWEQSQEDFLGKGEVTFQRAPPLMAVASAQASSSPASWPLVHSVLPAAPDIRTPGPDPPLLQALP